MSLCHRAPLQPTLKTTKNNITDCEQSYIYIMLEVICEKVIINLIHLTGFFCNTNCMALFEVEWQYPHYHQHRLQVRRAKRQKYLVKLLPMVAWKVDHVNIGLVSR